MPWVIKAQQANHVRTHARIQRFVSLIFFSFCLSLISWFRRTRLRLLSFAFFRLFLERKSYVQRSRSIPTKSKCKWKIIVGIKKNKRIKMWKANKKERRCRQIQSFFFRWKWNNLCSNEKWNEMRERQTKEKQVYDLHLLVIWKYSKWSKFLHYFFLCFSCFFLFGVSPCRKIDILLSNEASKMVNIWKQFYVVGVSISFFFSLVIFHFVLLVIFLFRSVFWLSLVVFVTVATDDVDVSIIRILFAQCANFFILFEIFLYHFVDVCIGIFVCHFRLQKSTHPRHEKGKEKQSRFLWSFFV